jgi:hypothetical protein
MSLELSAVFLTPDPRPLTPDPQLLAFLPLRRKPCALRLIFSNQLNQYNQQNQPTRKAPRLILIDLLG